MSDEFVIDLDQERHSRAAAREGRNSPIPIRLGGEQVAVLPVELPLDVFAPLRDMDEDLTMLLRQIMKVYQAQVGNRQQADAAVAWESADVIIDLLAANPSLPVNVIDTIKNMSINLLTPEGYTALMAKRPSTNDLAALARLAFRLYGVSLGESSSSTGSSSESGGATSSTTSSTTSDSTPDASTDVETTPTSSESVGSTT